VVLQPLPLCKVRFRWPRWVAVVTVLFLLAVVFAALGLIVTLTISDIIDNAGTVLSPSAGTTPPAID
jgi:predicted PurR-regulated permease PerM